MSNPTRALRPVRCLARALRGAALADALRRAAVTHPGHAGRAFLEKLTRDALTIALADVNDPLVCLRQLAGERTTRRVTNRPMMMKGSAHDSSSEQKASLRRTNAARYAVSVQEVAAGQPVQAAWRDVHRSAHVGRKGALGP